jgi:transcriptional regulator with XRE-family HTH domain
LTTLGPDGVLVREQIPVIIRDCHEKMANAQAEADMKHSGPYGYIWRRCLDEFSSVLGRLPSAELITVPRSGYKLVSFNGVVLFPWRFARERSVEVGARPFAVSDTKVSLFTEKRGSSDARLDIEFEHPELTEEEHAFLDAEGNALAAALATHARVVVVPYASNPSALHSVEWGEATLGADGYLTFESLPRPDLDAVADAFDPAPLTQARFAAGLSKVKLADLVGVMPAAIGQYEAQVVSPRRELLPVLARELDVPVDYFATGRPIGRVDGSQAHFRSLRSTTARDRAKAIAFIEQVWELTFSLEKKVRRRGDTGAR